MPSQISRSIFNVCLEKYLHCAGSDPWPPRQSCQSGRSSGSRRNFHCKVGLSGNFAWKMFLNRPWVAGGTLSEGDESEEENVEKLQGIIRSLLQQIFFWEKIKRLSGFSFLQKSLTDHHISFFFKDNINGSSSFFLLLIVLFGTNRSHSFRLRTLHEEDVFSVGKVSFFFLKFNVHFFPVQVSSIRAKFSRRSPDGASDDYLADSDRNVWSQD